MFGNLLKRAMSVIPSQTVELCRWNGETLNDLGESILSYADPVEIQGSFQAIDSKMAFELQLDTRKIYATLYTDTFINVVREGARSDRILFNGKTYEAISITDWHIDGWYAVLLVQI